MVLECSLPDIACVHEIGHEPVSVFFAEGGIEATFGVFNVVAELECGSSDFAEEFAPRGEANRVPRGSQADAVTSGGRLQSLSTGIRRGLRSRYG